MTLVNRWLLLLNAAVGARHLIYREVNDHYPSKSENPRFDLTSSFFVFFTWSHDSVLFWVCWNQSTPYFVRNELKFSSDFCSFFSVSWLFLVAYPTEITCSSQRPFLVRFTALNLNTLLTNDIAAFIVTLLSLCSLHISLHLYNTLWGWNVNLSWWKQDKVLFYIFIVTICNTYNMKYLFVSRG